MRVRRGANGSAAAAGPAPQLQPGHGAGAGPAREKAGRIKPLEERLRKLLARHRLWLERQAGASRRGPGTDGHPEHCTQEHTPERQGPQLAPGRAGPPQPQEETAAGLVAQSTPQPRRGTRHGLLGGEGSWPRVRPRMPRGGGKVKRPQPVCGQPGTGGGQVTPQCPPGARRGFPWLPAPTLVPEGRRQRPRRR